MNSQINRVSVHARKFFYQYWVISALPERKELNASFLTVHIGIHRKVRTGMVQYLQRHSWRLTDESLDDWKSIRSFGYGTATRFRNDRMCYEEVCTRGSCPGGSTCFRK